ncbi:HipA domain-containing protein [Microbacterium shaanxiense]
MTVAAHAVQLGGRRVGTILQRGDVARYVFEDGYWEEPDRDVLSLWFENNPRQSPQAALRLPPWFSNLLPEGPLRNWIAHDRGVSVDRELQLLLQIGQDLPGAVEVVPFDGELDEAELSVPTHALPTSDGGPSPWKFSLAGVGLKFSMLRHGDRLSIPAANQLGDWIVKFPDAIYPDVPSNEFATMSLAKEVGIRCPEFRLVHRDELPPVPEVMWPGREDLAYAIARFDRTPDGGRIHIEDLAQVRGLYPHQKYSGSFETVAGLLYRGIDHGSLQEFVRRLTFNLLVGNGDAHLKNWSLIFEDGRHAALSPAYDLVSTAGYYAGGTPDDLGLRFGGSRLPHRVTRSDFVRLQNVLHVAPADVLDVVDGTLERFFEAWGAASRECFPAHARSWIAENFEQMAKQISGADR